MQLVRLQFQAFSPGTDIEADIGQGWCAGVTASVSANAGSDTVQSGLDENEWALQTFKNIGRLLDSINSKSTPVTIKGLQDLMGTANIDSVKDVCGDIHKPGFNGHACKVLLSTTSWVPSWDRSPTSGRANGC